jgi:hypothetical protein
MITKFKLYESVDTSDLVEQFDEEFVNEYFDEHFKMNAQEIIELWPNTGWKFIDDDEYVDDLIDGEISSYGIEDYSDDDYKPYINENITDEIENIVIKRYNKKNKTTNDYYDSNMLDDLSEKQLRKIITSKLDESEFVEYVVRNRYEGRDAEDICSEWLNMDDGREVYKHLSQYIDDDAVVEDWMNDVDKRERLEEEIYRSPILQKKLLSIKKSNALLLADLFLENTHDDDNISKTYKFQKAYITKYIKKNIDGDSLTDALKFLDDNFELNSRIMEDYRDNWYISTKKYNI